MSKIKGTYGTMYYVTDMDSAIRFYKEKLGLQPTMESPHWSEFNVNGHALCLHPTDNKKNITHSGAIILHVDNIEGYVASLKTKGVNGISGPHQIKPGEFHAQCEDLEGNVITLYQGPEPQA